MFIRKYWIPISVFIVAIVGIGLYVLSTQPPPEPVKIYKVVEPIEKPPKQPTAEAPVEDTTKGGHFHADGTWREGAHEAHTPAGQNTTPPGAVTTPDFPPDDPNADPVATAYERLEYIKNNPYAWGGVHSERATEIIAEVMPPPVLMDHAHGEVVAELLAELMAQNDPRAAEVLITHMCSEWGISGTMMLNGLDAIGPPAVPYILPYLEKDVTEGGRIDLSVFTSLGRIGAAHRGDLGGIVEHIIIPKLEVIAADKDKARYTHATVLVASETLSVLGR